MCIPLIEELLAFQGVRKELQYQLQSLHINKALNICLSYSPNHGKYCQELQLSEQQHSSETVLPTMSLEKDSFSEEEHCLFERRYEEGYDIADTRYQKWHQQRKAISVNLSNSPPLQNFQCSLSVVPAHDQQHSDDAISQFPDELQEVHDVNSSEQGKILAEPLWKEFLKVPSPAYKITHSSSGKAQVLTSASFLHNLTEKEKNKKLQKKRKDVRRNMKKRGCLSKR